MTNRTGLLTLACLFAASLPSTVAAQSTLPLKHAPQPTTPDITAADLMTRLYIFADDSMQGREAGTVGDVKGTDYIAAELEKMGVRPAGDDGTYFQTIPYDLSTLDTTSVIAVRGESLRLGQDFIPSSRESVEVRSLPTVYGGVLSGTDVSLPPDQARGRLVVVVPGPDTNFRQLRRLSVPGASAVAVVGLNARSRRFQGYFMRPRGVLADPSAPPQAARIQISDEVAQRIFSRSLDGLEVGASGAPMDLHIRFDTEPMPYPARNVVGIIPGSDPALRGEYVAIGAHNDHIGITDSPVAHDSIRIWNHVVRPEGADDRDNQATPEQQAKVNQLLAQYRAAHPGPVRMDSISNGADDDGSGSVTVLEIAERIASMNPRPKRSILLVFHTGEEKGLLGSRYFTDHPTVPRDSIVAQLNMDMVGRGDAEDETGRTMDGKPLHGGPDYLMLVGSRRLSTELGDLVERVNTADGHGLHFDYSLDVENHPSNIYQRSDHYEYARYGIPIVFFTTGLHSDYHQVTDEAEYIDYDHMARIANFVEDVALHVADLDHRLTVDHPIAAQDATGRR